MSKQFKAFEFKVSEAGDDGKIGYIEGYASTFGNCDLGDDIVDKGAFKKTIKEKKGVFPILLDHNPSKPIGWNVEASEDDVGLKIKGEVQLITEEARNRYALAKRAKDLGTKMGLSIGYMTVKGEPDKERPSVRRLKELKLFEYSFVTFPMNEKATITGVKSDEWTALFEALQAKGYDLERVKNALKELGLDPVDPSAADIDTDPELLQSVDKLLARLRA